MFSFIYFYTEAGSSLLLNFFETKCIDQKGNYFLELHAQFRRFNVKKHISSKRLVESKTLKTHSFLRTLKLLRI